MAGQLWGWGNNGFGQLADNTSVNKISPVQTIAFGTDWSSLFVGFFHVGAIKTDKTLWTWGRNSYGQLGDNTITHRSSPVQTVAGGTNWNVISCGVQNTACIKTDGTLWLWGRNSYGGLGDNTTTNKSSPIQTVAGGSNWISVACGFGHTAAIKADGTLWTWGRNSHGQLGDNSLTNKSSPIQTITGGNNWSSVSCGYNFVAAIKTDGTLWLWGQNTILGAAGQLGDNTGTSKSSPVQTITGGNNWSNVDCGKYFTAAVKTDGTLWTWGEAFDGQLGDNTGTRKSSPVQTVAFGTNWSFVTCGNYYTAAKKTDGSLWTWGRNSYGQLGDNTTVNKSSPVQTVMGGNRWSAVGTGYSTAAIYENTPSALSITTQPANAYNAQKILNQPVVAVVDSAGNIVTTSQAVITAALASGSPSLTGTTNILVSGGIAQFTDLTLSGLGSGSLIFTASGLTSAISNYVAVEQSSIAIVPKRSETAGRVPDTTQLRNGELAINIADKKGYVKNSSGSIVNVFTGLGADVITSGMIGENAVNTRDIAPGAVGSSELASGVIGGTNTQILYNQSGGIAGTAALTLSTTSGVVTIAPQNAGYNALTLRSFTSQTADLLKVQNSAGSDIARVTSSGEWVGPLGSGVVLSGFIASGQIGVNHLASGVISTAVLGSGQVTSGSIASGSVGQFKLSSGAVNSGHIGNNAVVSGSIASGSVGTFHIASGSITSDLIASGAIINADVADNAVTSGKIASGTIGTLHISSGGVQNVNIASGAVLSGNIASGQIGNFHIASGAVTSGEIGNAAVVSGSIASGSIGSVHLSSGAIGVAGSSGQLQFNTGGSLGANAALTYSATGPYLGVNSQNASYTGMVLKGALNQTADMLQIQNSSGSIPFAFGVSGQPTMRISNNSSGTITMRMLDDTYNTLSFEGTAGQLFSINNNLASGIIFSVNDISGIPLIDANADATVRMGQYAGNIGIGVATPSGKLHVKTGVSSGKAFVVQGFTSQTANLTEWQNVSGTVLSVVNASGAIGIGTSSPTAFLEVNQSTNKAVRIGDVAGSFDNTSYNPDISTLGAVISLQTGVDTTYRQSIYGYQDASANAKLAIVSRSDLVFATFKGLTTDGRSMVIKETTGNVGIGLMTPSGRLEVANTTSVDDLVMRVTGSGTLGAGLHLNAATANGRVWRMISTGASSTPGAGALGFYDSTATSYRMVINTSGSVGIGTSSPNVTLDVRSNIGGGGMMHLVSTNNEASIQYRCSGNAINTGWVVGNYLDDFIAWSYTYNAQVITCKPTGNIGIGNTTPSGRLSITNASGGYTASQYLQINGSTGDNSNYPGIELRGGTLANVYPSVALSNGGLALNLKNGYHTTSYPSQQLIDLNAGNAYMAFATSVSGTPTTRMAITNSGLIGIGTTTPAYRLNLVGGNEVGSRFSVTGTYAPVQFTGDGSTTVGGVNAYSNIVTFGRGTATGVNPDIVVNLSGSVGIGTVNPVGTLDVRVSGALGAIIGNWGSVTPADTTDRTLLLGPRPGGSNIVSLGMQKDANNRLAMELSASGHLAWWMHSSGTWSFRATLTNSGNFGLGIELPRAQLHVASGQAYFDSAQSDTTFPNAEAGITIKNTNATSGNYSTIYFGNASGGIDGVIGGIHNSIATGTGRRGGLAFGTAGSNSTGSVVERMRLNTEGYLGINTSTPSGQFQVTNSTAALIPAIIRGAASQSANLTEWQNVSGTVFAAVDANGRFLAQASGNFGGFSFVNDGGSDTGMFSSGDGSLYFNTNNSRILTLGTHPTVTGNSLTVSTAGISSADAFRVINGATTNFISDWLGNAGVNTANPSGRLHVEVGNASRIGVIVRGFTSQTANLTEWQNSSNTVIARVNASGEFFGLLSSGIVTSGAIASGSVGNFHLSSGAVTSGDIGNAAVVSGSIASGSIGLFHFASGQVAAGGANSQVQYNVSGALAGAAAMSYSTTSPHVTITATSGGYTPLVVKGTTSQTADVMQIQTSTGAVPFAFNLSGQATMTMTNSLGVPISMRLLDDSYGTISWEGSLGQLFSISNNMTGIIFSVNDISGIPSIDVNSDGTVRFAQYAGNVGIRKATPSGLLDVGGDAIINGLTVGRGGSLVGSGIITNTVLGFTALATNNSGYLNTAIGHTALYSNTTGAINTAIGTSAMYTNTTSIKNVAVGHAAMYSNTTGSYSTAVGVDALYYNVTGSFNNAFGHQALLYTTGSNNTGLGFRASMNLTSGTGNVTVGHQAGVNHSIGSYNTLLGMEAGYSVATGGYNVAVGYGALYTNTASGNTAVGTNALYSNTSGKFSVAVGYNSLYTNTLGTGHTAIGYEAAYTANSSDGVVAIGYQAMKNTTTGIGVAIGYQALLANTTGSYNVAISRNALLSNTVGNSNTAVGYAAMNSNVSGSNNCAFGSNALYNNTASNNTAIGNYALWANTSGAGSVAVGHLAGYTNTISALTAVGYLALTSGTNGGTAVGYLALAATTTGINNTGLGTAALTLNTTGSRNTATGDAAMQYNTTGSDNTAAGYVALYNNTTGGENTAIGRGAGEYIGNGSYNTAVGAYAMRYVSSGVSNNVAIGRYTLYGTAGGNNTAVGTNALYSNTASGNTGIGTNALNSNTSGTGQVAVGFEALYSNLIGNSNTAIGYQAAKANASGSALTAIGFQALTANTYGFFATAVGHLALSSHTTGNRNVAVGNSALIGLTTGANNVGIGQNVAPNLTAPSNVVVIGDNAVNTAAAGGNQTASTNSVYIGGSCQGYSNSDSNSIVIGASAIGQGANTTVIGTSSTVSGTIYGNINFPIGIRVNTGTSTNKGIVVQGAASQTANLTEWQNNTGTNLAYMDASGNFYAVSKSFLIDHPTKPGKKLRHVCVESPTADVYFRGKSKEKVIELPEYWTGLVNYDSITVMLSPVGKSQNLYFDRIEDNKVYVEGDDSPNYHFVIFGERKDIDKVIVEE